MKNLDFTRKINKVEAIILLNEDLDFIAHQTHSLEMLGLFTYLVLMSKTFASAILLDAVVGYIYEIFNTSHYEIKGNIYALKELGVLDIYFTF